MQKANASDVSLVARVRQQAAKFMKQPLRNSAILALQPYFQIIQRQRLLALSTNTAKVVVMLVPGTDSISGGILSIYAFYCATRKVLGAGATVLLGTYPNKLTSLRYRWFRNEGQLINFNLILDSFESNQAVCLHLLEYYVPYFLQELTAKQKSKLQAMENLHINVMNQNIQIMPAPEIINQLRQLTPHLTITTAHSSYTTPELRQLYGAPTHLLSAWFEQQEIEKVPYSGKQDILIVSPDEHPDKQKILAKIRQAFPALQLIVVKNMKYDDFKLLEAKAKWAISFGEGFDGYTIFPVLKGGVSFTVYNEDFFLPKYQAVPTFYPSYEALYESIVADMQRLDNAPAYEAYNSEVAALCQQDHSYEKYLQRVKEFYQEDYTLP